MLFCRKCGAQVSKGDLFCTNCLTRLDSENSVISKHEYSSILSEKIEFDPDGIVTDTDLSGKVIMDHRLLCRIGTFAGVTYYQARHTDNANDNTVVIRHIVFPDDFSHDYSLIMRKFDKNEENHSEKRFADALGNERAMFQSACAAACCNCLNYNSKSYYSGLYGKYHIFIMMKEALPLPYYAMKNELTLRDVLTIMHSVCDQLLKMHRCSIGYGSFSDEMIFVGRDGNVFLDFCQGKCYGQYFPYSAVYQHYRQFAAPADTDPEAYSVGLILLYLISGFRHPYINPQIRNVTGREFMIAERSRMAKERPWMPTLVHNMLGNAIMSVLDRSSRAISLEEFERVLSNAFNYLTAEELNSRISEQ